MQEPPDEQAVDPTQQQPMTDSAPQQQPTVSTNQTNEGRPRSRPQSPEQLCGWLEKKAGPLKRWKTRWFSHDERRSQLLYWRTPQDATPLGQVQLTDATFSYPLELQEEQEQGTFYIHTPQRTFILKAESHDLMMYWLQQLQLRRWQHRIQRGDTHTTVEFLPQVKVPVELVGQKAASRGSPGQRSPLNISLKHPIIEFQNLCLRGKSVSQLDQAPVTHLTPDTPTQVTANKETVSQDTANQETVSLDTANQVTVSLDTAILDTANQEMLSRDTPMEDMTSQDIVSPDTPTQDTANQKTASEDTHSQVANQETAPENTHSQVANQKTASEDTPIPDTANHDTPFLDTPTCHPANEEVDSPNTPTIYDTANEKACCLDTPTHDLANDNTHVIIIPTIEVANGQLVQDTSETTTQETASLASLCNIDSANQKLDSQDTPSEDITNGDVALQDKDVNEITNQDTPSLHTSCHNSSLDTPSIEIVNQIAALLDMDISSKEIANQQASLFKTTKATANQRSGFHTLPAQTRISTLRALRRRKGLSALLSPDHPGPDRTARLEMQVDTLQQELRKQEELVLSLYRALELSQREKRVCAEYLSVSGEEQKMEVLRHRERLVAKLQGEVAELQQRLKERDTQVCELQESVQLLLQKNQAKQEVVLKLSQQLADTHTLAYETHTLADETHTRADETHTRAATQGQEEKDTHLKEEIRHLKDDLEAYRTQNKFLNSEIHHLTELWRQSSQQEKSLMFKCAYLEASSCQKESRYLALLQQLRESVTSGAHTHSHSHSHTHSHSHSHTLRNLIDDALQGALSLSPAREFDAYGFKLVPDYEAADMQLLMRMNALELRTRTLLQEKGQRPLLDRWAQLLSNPAPNPAHTLSPSPELKALLRGGVPQEFRARVWRWLVFVRTRAVRESHPDRYRLLTQRSQSAPTAAAHQIQLDLHRTLTTNQRFSSHSSPAHEQLRRVLLAFSCHNPQVGYCQGLNRLAALSLLVLEDEEEAFWCLVAIIEAIMPPDYYTKSLLGYQVDQCVFGELLSAKVSRVSAHLDAHGVEVAHVTVSWFPSLFIELLPSDILLPLWDAFLYEGSKVLFRYALALLKYKEEEILKLKDATELFQYLFFFTKTIADAGRLRNIAFGDFNPLSKRHLRGRRAWHRDRLEAELRAQEAGLQEQSSQHAKRHDISLHDVASDDDDLN
ncbi:TBC1 domain family member 2A [Engraulis encrasicolus]|uniref:TBC1 domain family member 2A n=1 Tax=Engraulis encrasicolus TaxID=184585 RepID=UPI002FD277C0